MLCAGEKSCWPKVRFIANRMKVERVITEGLRRVKAQQESAYTDERLTYAAEQQNGEARLRSGKRLRNQSSADDGEKLNRTLSQNRRSSTMLEELSRQASVLWDDELPTDAEDAHTTDDDDEAHDSHEEVLEGV